MDSATFTKKCDACGLYLDSSNFYRNKAKNDGIQNRCKDCIKDYKVNLKLGITEKQPKVVRDFFYIPNIFIVGYGRSQTFQHCCLRCESPFFCHIEIKEFPDLLCDNCSFDETKIPETNIANVNYIGNVVGWLSKLESPSKVRKSRNYKKTYERDKYTCQYCGYNLKNAKKFLPLHIDHVKPWSAHGGNSLNNLVVSCQECNLIASDKWFVSFEEKKDYIEFERQKSKFRRV
jgi:5-methylcytosine-specific restriction endonuclease McrA